MSTPTQQTNDEGDNVRLAREIYGINREARPATNGQRRTTPATLCGHTNSTKIIMIA